MLDCYDWPDWRVQVRDCKLQTTSTHSNIDRSSLRFEPDGRPGSHQEQPSPPGRAESRCSGAIDLAAISKFVELGGGVAQHSAIIRLATALQLFDLWTEPDEVQPCDSVVDEG